MRRDMVIILLLRPMPVGRRIQVKDFDDPVYRARDYWNIF
jgi:hypothetical protein